MDTPVVFVVFNRPAVTGRILERIRQARPQQLTVVSDGPRAGRSGEAKQVAETRALIERALDWPCEVHRDYAEENLGCGPRVASGLTAAFERYDRAIVLEDDTLPEPSFFTFCETMLDRYAGDPNVMHVSGTNAAAALGEMPSRDAYCLNRIPDIWGWATWSRAWQNYDFGIEEWSTVRQTDWLRSFSPLAEEQAILRGVFDNQYELRENPRTWDWSWIYACLRGGRTVTPLRNLVSNLGFGRGATNTKIAGDRLSEMPTAPIDIEQLNEPDTEAADRLDALLLAHRFGGADARQPMTIGRRFAKSSLGRRLRRLVG